jgi:hypothetical protein
VGGYIAEAGSPSFPEMNLLDGVGDSVLDLLEADDLKQARPVLRGQRGRGAPALPDAARPRLCHLFKGALFAFCHADGLRA